MAVVLLVAASLAVWALTRDDNSGVGDQAGTHSLSPLDGDDPGVAHVHGLGVDPKDGVLYAATHYGLFRIPRSGAATRVANRYQDTMGFTVAGPGRFLGSGHPDQREDLPPLLGLIESTDGGVTWQKKSLLGEVDFHSLEYAHGRIYGFDSSGGRLMVSSDGEQWDTRATLRLFDFAVSPADPDVIVATTQSGLQRSDDGGRRFRSLSGPTLVVLGWRTAGELWGVTPAGDVLLSADSGASWRQRSSLAGSPEAFAAEGNALYAAVSGKGIYESTDNGRTWSLRYEQDHE